MAAFLPILSLVLFMIPFAQSIEYSYFEDPDPLFLDGLLGLLEHQQIEAELYLLEYLLFEAKYDEIADFFCDV